MKILLINWSWYPTGGDWTYVNNLQALYKQNGYEVVSLSTQNEKNFDTNPKSNSYFINSPDYKLLNKNKNVINGFKAIKNSVVSFDALKAVDQILKSHDIKIAHLHNIHHYITPAIIWKLKKAGVKIVWSLHDYKIICPESSFISNGKICEKCITGSFYQCSVNKCKKNSLAASMLASAEAYFYHKTGVYNKVDAYLCPSSFLEKKFKQFGFSESKLHVTNLCYDISIIDDFLKVNEKPIQSGIGKTKEEEYILYIGRIEEIKGIKTLMNAVKNSTIKLKIAGSGNSLIELKEWAIREKMTNIEFLGFQDKLSIFELTARSKFVVCPSEWYENFPFSIIESFLFSKPVVGSNIGGIPELVIEGETGYLFETGNVNELREKITRLWNNETVINEMGAKAKKYIDNIVNFKTHWSKLNLIINNITSNGN